jgi:hypothetical protein
MRLLALLSSISLALVACSSAPEPPTATESQALVLQHCPAGEAPSCTPGRGGAMVCTCVPIPPAPPPPPPPVCDFQYPTSSAPAYCAAWVESWAASTSNGLCPEIVTSTGTWAPLDLALASSTFNGVPTEASFYTPGNCNTAFASAAPCCTYVWWPNGFDPSTPANEQGPCPAQDTAALCTTTTVALLAIEQTQYPCDPPDSGLNRPGSGGCGTCAGVLR